MQTSFLKKAEIERSWFVLDAEGQVLGRLASRIARILTGKEKPVYAPFLDTGDHVIVINADKVRLTGAKEQDKHYFHHSGYPGGIRQLRAGQVRARQPERLIEAAVRGMLPKNKLGRAQFRKLKVCGGSEHPHQAQKPQQLGLGNQTGAADVKTGAAISG
jgi:large subunit ribosomal protein L13